VNSTEINFSGHHNGMMVSSILCDHCQHLKTEVLKYHWG